MGIREDEKENKNWGIIEEPRVVTTGLDVIPEIRDLFHRQCCEWMARPPGQYGNNMVRKFYASYVATTRKNAPSKAKEIQQPILTSTLVPV